MEELKHKVHEVVCVLMTPDFVLDLCFRKVFVIIVQKKLYENF